LNDPTYQGVLVLPLRVEARTLGCPGFTFAGPLRAADCDLGYTAVVAHHCAQALARAVLYEQATRADMAGVKPT
jgi:hypothetical protein